MARGLSISQVRALQLSGRSLTKNIISDSVVSRDPDNNYSTHNEYFGVKFETETEWSKIGGRISSNTADATRAYIYRVSDGKLIGDTNISALSSNDEFIIDLDNNLVSWDSYEFVLDAEGSSYTLGHYDDDFNAPYTSHDGVLTITEGVRESYESSTINGISEIGYVGIE
jgi:hypothetical protein